MIVNYESGVMATNTCTHDVHTKPYAHAHGQTHIHKNRAEWAIAEIVRWMKMNNQATNFKTSTNA